MDRLWAILIGYLFGNFLFAMVVGKYCLHIDPTKYGSHNPGTANMGAVFNKKWGILTCLGDLIKSFLAVGIVYFGFKHNLLLIAYTGLGLVLGHCFPLLNKLQGGKGVAVAAVVAVCYNWQAGLITLLIALVLTIFMKNLTIPPQMFILLFSVYIIFGLHEIEAGIIFLAISAIMIIRFWRDSIDFFTGHGKKVDILYSIKKKLLRRN